MQAVDALQALRVQLQAALAALPLRVVTRVGGYAASSSIKARMWPVTISRSDMAFSLRGGVQNRRPCWPLPLLPSSATARPRRSSNPARILRGVQGIFAGPPPRPSPLRVGPAPGDSPRSAGDLAERWAAPPARIRSPAAAPQPRPPPAPRAVSSACRDPCSARRGSGRIRTASAAATAPPRSPSAALGLQGFPQPAPPPQPLPVQSRRLAGIPQEAPLPPRSRSRGRPARRDFRRPHPAPRPSLPRIRTAAARPAPQRHPRPPRSPLRSRSRSRTAWLWGAEQSRTAAAAPRCWAVPTRAARTFPGSHSLGRKRCCRGRPRGPQPPPRCRSRCRSRLTAAAPQQHRRAAPLPLPQQHRCRPAAPQVFALLAGIFQPHRCRTAPHGTRGPPRRTPSALPGRQPATVLICGA